MVIQNWVIMGIQWMVCWWVLVQCGQLRRWHLHLLEWWGLRNNIWAGNITVFQFLWGEHLANFVQNISWNYTEKKLDSESTDFLFRFKFFFWECGEFYPILQPKKKTQLSYISKIFTNFFSQNWKKFATKENSGSYPPQSFSNSGIAYPPNQRFCFGEIFPNFDLKNIISTHTKDFLSKKKRPKFARFWKRKFPNRQMSGTWTWSHTPWQWAVNQPSRTMP